ncbi:unnamed protein product, partial [Musa banksii]
MAETLSITDSIKIERDHGSQSGEYRFDVPLDTDRAGIPENPVKEDVKEALPNISESVNETSDAYWN